MQSVSCMTFNFPHLNCRISTGRRLFPLTRIWVNKPLLITEGELLSHVTHKNIKKTWIRTVPPSDGSPAAASRSIGSNRSSRCLTASVIDDGPPSKIDSKSRTARCQLTGRIQLFPLKSQKEWEFHTWELEYGTKTRTDCWPTVYSLKFRHFAQQNPIPQLIMRKMRGSCHSIQTCNAAQDAGGILINISQKKTKNKLNRANILSAK